VPSPSSPTRRFDPIGLLWATLAAAFGSTVGVAGKFLMSYQAGPLPTVALRAALAAAFVGLGLLALQRRAFRISPRDLPFFALYGLVGVAVLYALFIWSVQLIGAALATTLFYVYPTLASLLAAAFLHEPLSFRKVVPLPVTFAGCALVAGLFSGGEVHLRPLGIVVSLLAAVTYALYPLFTRRTLARYSVWTALFYSLSFGALWLGLLWVLLGLFRPATDSLLGALPALRVENLSFWGGVLYLSLGATVGLYTAHIQALRRLQVRQVGLVGTTEPVLAGLLAMALFGEYLTWLQWVGVAVILLGVAWLRWGER
jgi:DME family drug/metabolite transporter